MLVLTSATLATVDELFRYKKTGFKLDYFPGYTPDQWGIKAHNRPWIEEVGKFSKDQKIIEVGGAYSLLPKYLSEKYELEAWIGDDFGQSTGESIWSRWGNPDELSKKYPSIKYVFEPFGCYSTMYSNQSFDRIFSVSTLEHIPYQKRLDVFKDMNRCLAPGGIQLHTIDIGISSLKKCLLHSITDRFPILNKLTRRGVSEIRSWFEVLEASGIKIDCSMPNSISLLERSILVESYDVVYRFYPPKDDPKHYHPSASLLIFIENK